MISDDGKHGGSSARRMARRLVGSGGIHIPVAILVLVVIAQAENSRFLTWDNWRALLATVAVLTIVSIGQCIAVVAGGFDLSVGGVVPLAGVIFALLLNAGHPFAVCLVLTLLLGVAIGLVNSFIIVALKVDPLIATLAMLSITTGAAFTAADGGTVAFDDGSAPVFGGDIFGVPSPIVLALALVAASHLVLSRSSYGRRIYAIGGNAQASWLAGVPVNAVTTSVYVLSATLAALAGLVLSEQLLAGSASSGADTALNSITAVILGGAALSGGVGSISGTVGGVLILGIVSNGLALAQVKPFYQQIVTGVILALAVASRGAGGLMTAVRRRRMRRVSAV